MWDIFRMENEHLNNCGQYRYCFPGSWSIADARLLLRTILRAVRWIPLLNTGNSDAHSDKLQVGNHLGHHRCDMRDSVWHLLSLSVLSQALAAKRTEGRDGKAGSADMPDVHIKFHRENTISPAAGEQ